MSKYRFIPFLLLTGALCSVAHAAVRPQLTRVVAYAQDKETSVEIINDSSETYMVQSWLEDNNGKDSNIPLVLTPPVMKLEGKKQGKLRLVVLNSEIPQDRESVFWLSLQEIPPKAKDIDNRLVVAIRSRLKVFVRPQGLNSTDAIKAAQALTWSMEKNGSSSWLKATNPTPYYISFGELAAGSINGKAVRLDDKHNMVPPMGSQRYQLPAYIKASKVNVTWSSINDWGGAGTEYKVEVLQ